jgi:hypothetical protein
MQVFLVYLAAVSNLVILHVGVPTASQLQIII